MDAKIAGTVHDLKIGECRNVVLNKIDKNVPISGSVCRVSDDRIETHLKIKGQDFSFMHDIKTGKPVK